MPQKYKEQIRFLASHINELHTSYRVCLTKGLGFCAAIQNKQAHTAPEKQLVTPICM